MEREERVENKEKKELEKNKFLMEWREVGKEKCQIKRRLNENGSWKRKKLDDFSRVFDLLR